MFFIFTALLVLGQLTDRNCANRLNKQFVKILATHFVDLDFRFLPRGVVY